MILVLLGFQELDIFFCVMQRHTAALKLFVTNHSATVTTTVLTIDGSVYYCRLVAYPRHVRQLLSLAGDSGFVLPGAVNIIILTDDCQMAVLAV